MNSYKEMKERQQQEYNSFSEKHCFYAFSNEQFSEGMGRLGLAEGDTDRISQFWGGGFVLKTKEKEMKALLEAGSAEMERLIEADEDGTGFIKDMFRYELANHEYCITGCISDTLGACGLSGDDVNASPALQNGLRLALAEYAEGEAACM